MEPLNSPNRTAKSLSSAAATTPSPADGQSSSNSNSKKTMRNGGAAAKLPSPRDLISHYESQGMDTQQASLKVIQDLQSILFRMVTSSSPTTGSGSSSSSGRRKGLRPADANATTSRKLDVLNARLINIDIKLDSKPGYPQTLAIGVASAVALRGFDAVFPHLAGALSNIWNTIRSATTTSSSS